MALPENIELPLSVVEAISREGEVGALSKETLSQVNAALEKVAAAPNLLELKPKLDELTKAGGGRFYDIERLKETYEKLDVEISPDQLRKMKEDAQRDLESEDFDKFLVRAKKFSEITEDGKHPLIHLAKPTLIVTDGAERSNSIESMEGVMQELPNQKPLQTGKCVPENVMAKVWPTGLQAWTSANLKESKNKRYNKGYDHQLDHQVHTLLSMNDASEADIQKITKTPINSSERQAFVQKYGIKADMFLAMNLHRIATGEELMQQELMRLNTRGTDGDPLVAYINDDALYLYSSPAGKADLDGGIGASLRISS